LVVLLGPKKLSAHWALHPNIAVLVEEGKMVFFFSKTQLLSTPRKDACTSTSKEARSFDIFKPQEANGSHKRELQESSASKKKGD
jgi:hypothetical protein